MQNLITLPSLPVIEQPGAIDKFLLCDMPGFAQAAAVTVAQGKAGSGGSWMGDQSPKQALDYVTTGDLSGVPAAEKFMTQFEGQVFVSKTHRVINDVCGAVPNVPAFIAGIPTSMRRRQRLVADTAPLSVFIDLTSSGGIDASDVRKRGCAILALVMLLSNIRPIETWCFTGLGKHGIAAYVAVRLDTAPLDLARSAHMLTSTAVARGLGYGTVHSALHMPHGAWPYGSIDKQRRYGAEIMKRVVEPGSEVLFIPPVYSDDKAISDPVAWIKDMLAQYGGQTVAQED